MAAKTRNQVIPAVFLILRKEDKVLLQRRFNTGFQDGQYTFPSGHVEINETPLAAACREAKEEAGVDIKPENIIFEQVLYRRSFNLTGNGFDPSKTERVDFFFSADKWEGEPKITEPEKCDDLRWFSLSVLPVNLFSVVQTFLKNYPNPKPYQESGY